MRQGLICYIKVEFKTPRNRGIEPRFSFLGFLLGSTLLYCRMTIQRAHLVYAHFRIVYCNQGYCITVTVLSDREIPKAE